jgi:hypothetical protein
LLFLPLLLQAARPASLLLLLVVVVVGFFPLGFIGSRCQI